MKAIVAVDKEWGIGKNNGLLFSLKKDMAFFREQTLGKVVCMGKNTLLSFPSSRPLPKRTNIVLSDTPLSVDCTVVGSLHELSKELSKYNSDDIFVIGGAQFYRTMLPYLTSVLVTKVDASGDAQVFFDNLDENPNWTLVSESDPIEDNGYTIRFTEYRNSNPKHF